MELETFDRVPGSFPQSGFQHSKGVLAPSLLCTVKTDPPFTVESFNLHVHLKLLKVH